MNSKNIKRRSFLKKVGVAGATIAASTSFATPALSDNHKEWILVSAFGRVTVIVIWCAIFMLLYIVFCIFIVFANNTTIFILNFKI